MRRSMRLLLALACALWGHLHLVSASAFIDTPTEIFNVNEGDITVPVCVNLTTPQDGNVTVSTSPLSSTITDSDLDELNEELTFTTTGPTRQCVDLVVHSDDVVENTELLQIQLRQGSIVVGAPSRSIITIRDTSKIDVSFTEESFIANGETNAINICAQIVNGSIERTVSIFFESIDLGTASSVQDYIPISSTPKSFTPTTAHLPQCTPLTLLQDTIIEEDETLTISLTSTPGGQAVNIIADMATVSIKDDDGVNLFLTESSFLVSEGNAGLTNVSVGIRVSWPSGYSLQRSVTVLATTMDSSATADSDFVPLNSEPFTIPMTATNNEVFNFITQIVGDQVQEDDELYLITFSGQHPNDTFPNNPRARVRILNDGDLITDCGALEAPSNGQVTLDPNTLQDSVANYSCDVGYSLIGNQTRTCQHSGWDGLEPACQIVDCSNPPEIENGIIMLSTTEYLGQAIYSCLAGYELNTGTPTVTRSCQADAMWSGEVPQCVRVDCGDLPDPDNGVVAYPDGGTRYQDRAQYQCNSGYNLQGTTERLCMADRQWSSTAPTCERIDCGNPPEINNGNVALSSTEYLGQAVYSCLAGYELNTGTPTFTRNCRIDAMWSGEVPQCVRVDCGNPPEIDNGNVALSTTEYLGQAIYSCLAGYELNTGTPTFTRSCQADAMWSGEVPQCVRVDCGNPPEIDNGKVLWSSTGYTGQSVYSCLAGYELNTGAQTVTRSCQADATWSGEVPQCVRVDCGVLPNPDNGHIVYPDSGTRYQDRAQYRCNPGYNLQGTTERLCMANIQWSKTTPTCEPVNCGELTVPENGNVDVPSTLFPAEATYSCNGSFVLVNGPEVRMCQTSGTWSEDAPTCQDISCSRDANGECIRDELSTLAIIVAVSVSVGGFLIGIILTLILVGCIMRWRNRKTQRNGQCLDTNIQEYPTSSPIDMVPLSNTGSLRKSRQFSFTKNEAYPYSPQQNEKIQANRTSSNPDSHPIQALEQPCDTCIPNPAYVTSIPNPAYVTSIPNPAYVTSIINEEHHRSSLISNDVSSGSADSGHANLSVGMTTSASSDPVYDYPIIKNREQENHKENETEDSDNDGYVI